MHDFPGAGCASGSWTREEWKWDREKSVRKSLAAIGEDGAMETSVVGPGSGFFLLSSAAYGWGEN